MSTAAPSRAPQAAYEVPADEYYATLARWRGYSYRERRRLLLPRLGGRVLDVGCGDGRIVLAALADRGVGLDASGAMLAAARARAPLARLTRADAQALPFRGASFETVLASHALWLFGDAQAFVAEARRVLVPGGRLVIVSNHPHYFWARSCVLGISAAMGRHHVEPPPLLHRRRDIEAALRRAGFLAARSESFLVLPVPGFAWLDRTPLRRLGLSFVIEARAPA
ncbi:MAG: class I SAM-dependent methyltransferase [bacterium]